MAWINKDGLKVKFDVEKIEEAERRGESPGAGVERQITVQCNLVELGANGAKVYDNVIIPRNSLITQVDVLNVGALTGGTSVAVGLIELNYTDEYDYDGLLAGYDTATAGLKTEIHAGETDAGALVGTKTLKPGVLRVVATGTYTNASEISVTVHLMVPDKDPVPAVWT